MQVFVDTSYFIARLVARDQWHKKARKVTVRKLIPVTSSLVVNETISLLQARGLLSAALAFLQGIRDDPETRIIYPDPSTQSQAWDLFGRYGPLGANAVDCVSFAIMRSLAIRRALTFDQHFRLAGFDILP